MWPDWYNRHLQNKWSQTFRTKLRGKTDDYHACPQTGLCGQASGVQFTLGNEPLSAHNTVMRRWQLWPSVFRHWKGQCPLSLLLHTRLCFRLLCSSAEEAEVLPAAAPSLLEYSFALVWSLSLEKLASPALSPSRHLGVYPSKSQTKFI